MDLQRFGQHGRRQVGQDGTVSGSWLPWVHGDAFLPVPTSMDVYQRRKRWSCEDVNATSWVEEHIGGVVVRLT
jgi:hypothetical protein